MAEQRAHGRCCATPVALVCCCLTPVAPLLDGVRDAANELYRKCVKDCDAAIKANPHCLRAYSFKGQALLKRGKKSSAASAWRAGVQAGATGGDVAVYAELRAQLDGTDKKAEPAGAAADSTPDAASTGVTPAPAAPAPAVPRSSGDAGAAEGPKAVAAASPAAPPLAAAASRGKPETGSAAAEEVIEVVGSGGSVDASAPRAKARGGAGSASKETARSKKAKRTSAQSKRKDGATDATDIAVSDTLDKFRELAQQQQRSPMAAARAQAQLAALEYVCSSTMLCVPSSRSQFCHRAAPRCSRPPSSSCRGTRM